MNPPASNSIAKSAPKAASWAYAETFRPETDAAAWARESAVDLGISPLGRGTAATLTVLARALAAKAVVEIGTGTGVSGLALFAGMQPDGILTSVDIEPEHQQVARKAFMQVGIPTQRFRLISGAALSVLPRLREGAYDLVFVDGEKTEYADYVSQAIRLLRSGGILAVDNALWHDRVADPNDNDEPTMIIRETLAAVAENEELVSALLPVGDGLLVAVKG
ncbi:MAG TPA: O-methyltransferase [Microlunatus sp.]|nr:O-methyltransferase [Microlunatus sp.]